MHTCKPLSVELVIAVDGTVGGAAAWADLGTMKGAVAAASTSALDGTVGGVAA